jgi:hypothetical protein
MGRWRSRRGRGERGASDICSGNRALGWEGEGGDGSGGVEKEVRTKRGRSAGFWENWDGDL